MLVQFERFIELDRPPCAWSQAPLRLLAVLRDPAQRAQVRRLDMAGFPSALPHIQTLCILHSPPLCTDSSRACAISNSAGAQLTQASVTRTGDTTLCHAVSAASASLNERAPFACRVHHLCDAHRPLASFEHAVSVTHRHHGIALSSTSTEPEHVLGRYTRAVVREVYSHFFGSFRAQA